MSQTRRKLLLCCKLCAGDVVTMTAAVRDLHRAFPGRFITDVETTVSELWRHNPHITPLDRGDPDLTVIDMHYPRIHTSNVRSGHFIEGYSEFLGQQLDLRIPMTAFRGDIHLSQEERSCPKVASLRGDSGLPLWIIVAGGKYDYTAKWWVPDFYQAVVDHFRGKIRFVQCGAAGDWHVPLRGVVDMVGKTPIRDFVKLMYVADGVLCPVTFAMHLAAAVPTRTRALRPCVVVAGGREPPHWEAYPGHQFLHTVGALHCCAAGGCWRGRCQLVGDGDLKDRHNVCEQPVSVQPGLRIPRCMTAIRPSSVIAAIENYLCLGSPYAEGVQI